MKNVLTTLLLTLLALTLSACGGGGASDSGDVQMTLIPAPEGASGRYLTLQLADAEGQPITDASLDVEGNMNHAGMVPVEAEGVVDDADGAIDGRYQVPFTFTMLGDWIITVEAEREDGSTAMRNFELVVENENITITDEN